MPLIADFLARWGAALVWSNSSVTPVGALAAARLSLPHVWHLRENSGPGTGFEFDCPLPDVVRLIRASCKRVAVSEWTRSHYEHLGCGPCSTVYSSIGGSKLLAARRGAAAATARIHRPLRLLVVGRVTEEKGQHLAIQALRKLVDAGHDAELRIVGEGTLRRCREQAERSGVAAQVELTGFRQDMTQDYLWCDLVLNCCPVEPMGRVTAEAMSFGRPVVAHSGGGNAELIEHGVTGMLFDDCPQSLVDRLLELTRDAELRRRLSINGQREAGLRFSSERYVERLMELVSDAAGTPQVAGLGFGSDTSNEPGSL